MINDIVVERIFCFMEQTDFAFLDSGTGGIPYMLDLKEKQPDATCVYLGDTAHFPYGEKSPGEVVECATGAISLIIREWNPRTLVIACNTISVEALPVLRERFPALKIVGTVPAIKLGAKVTRNGKIGLVATSATVSNGYTRKLIEEFAADCDVFLRADPELVHFVERRLISATEKEREDAVRKSVDFFREKGCDTIILGCTHFTHLADTFRRVAGKEISIVDSRNGVSNRALTITERDSDEEHLPSDCAFFVTAATEEEEKEYRALCRCCSIPWGGTIRLSEN